MRKNERTPARTDVQNCLKFCFRFGFCVFFLICFFLFSYSIYCFEYTIKLGERDKGHFIRLLPMKFNVLIKGVVTDMPGETTE